MTPRVAVAEQPGVGPDGRPRPSEDVAVVLPNAVLVLDGVTAAHADRPSGGWYAGELARRLAERLTATPDGDLADLLAGAIEAVAGAHGLVARASPSSTVAVLRWSRETVDALVLADSPVVVFTGTGPEVLADDRLASLPRSARGSVAAIDAVRNRDGGFWVAEADPAAAYQARRARWPRAEVSAALVASDGVSCGVDDYLIFPDWSAVLDIATSDGPRAVLDRIRAAELADPDRTRWPRAKSHDDQALVLVDFAVTPSHSRVPPSHSRVPPSRARDTPM